MISLAAPSTCILSNKYAEHQIIFNKKLFFYGNSCHFAFCDRSSCSLPLWRSIQSIQNQFDIQCVTEYRSDALEFKQLWNQNEYYNRIQRKTEMAALQAKGNHLQRIEGSSQPQKSNFKELYVCFCQKQYQSFPALYLHIRQKHDIFIKKAQKTEMKTSLIQNGDKKFVVYQAIEEILRKTKEEGHSSNIYDGEGEVQLQRSLEINSNQKIMLPNQFKNFLQFLRNGTHGRQPQDLDEQKVLDLITVLYSSFLKDSRSVCSAQSISPSLPLFFNSFMMEIIPKSEFRDSEPQPIKQILLQLSRWLYDTKQSPYLVIINDVQQS